MNKLYQVWSYHHEYLGDFHNEQDVIEFLAEQEHGPHRFNIGITWLKSGEFKIIPAQDWLDGQNVVFVDFDKD